ncbi:general secretion pathway protein F [Rubritalea squalenifaciens DSM 18772]|uniref:General secretion pathway protein F n=2 Tax=Rubritalea TaxID=361050 RepID=A0A1M6H0J1_9BACT|nr:type II secretion system F family protein [Rubritalea squalenifaciens]SHJ15727.1 general secretion pathway protein F [Rubritalea squalenifaciens DSM 18772]
MSKIFKYIAIDGSGQKQTGDLTAASRGEAMRLLQGRGFQPTQIKDAGEAKVKKVKASTADEPSSGPLTLKKQEIIAFTEELSELLEAGLPLEPALASMEAREEKGQIKYLSGRLRKWVTEGTPLYEAMKRVSPDFDQLYCNLVRAGEASGSLQTILRQHGTYMKEQQELKSRLKLALIYPTCLTLACVALALVFIFFLLPRITVLLEGMPGSEMPIGVKISTFIGDFLRAHWLKTILFFCAIAVGIKVWLTKEENLRKWDEWKLSIPLYGNVIRYGFYVQWLQTLANLVSNGVPLVQALKLTEQTVTNRYYKERLTSITERVSDGYKLTRSMQATAMFAPNMIDLIGVGENTGKLSRALERASAYYDKHLSALLASLLGTITPVVLVLMAVLVGGFSYTMIQAIYQTINNIKS